MASLRVLALATIVKAACHISSLGTSSDLILRGDVLTPGGVLHNGQLLIQNGVIKSIGHGCSNSSSSDATIINCPGAAISPGFIVSPYPGDPFDVASETDDCAFKQNTHEHIAYSTITPFPDNGELYDHRHDWRKGLRGHTMREAEINGTAMAAVQWGELRHLLSGTTSIVGEDFAPGLTRNLDNVAGLEAGLLPPTDRYDIFPLDDIPGIQVS